MGEDFAEITHEALVRSWPRLRGWLADDRAGVRVHQQLAVAAQEWDALERDTGALYRGARLAVASQWAAADSSRLTALEEAFLATSEGKEQGELTATRRRTRQLRWLAAALALMLVVSAAVAVMAWTQRQESRSRELAAQAMALVSAELAVEAFDTAPTVEARSALFWFAATRGLDVEKLDASLPAGTLFRYRDGRRALAYSPDRKFAAMEQDKSVAVVDTGTNAKIGELATPEGRVDIAVGPNAELVAIRGDGKVVIFNRAQNQPVRTLPVTGNGHMTFSPRGDRLAISGLPPSISIWDTGTGHQITSFALPDNLKQDNELRCACLVFSPDGQRLAAVHMSGVTVWNAHQPGTRPLPVYASMSSDVAFSADGGLLATKGPGHVFLFKSDTAQLWATLRSDNQQGMAWHPRDDRGFATSYLGRGAPNPGEQGPPTSTSAETTPLQRAMAEYDQVDVWTLDEDEAIRTICERLTQLIPLHTAAHAGGSTRPTLPSRCQATARAQGSG